MTGWTVPARNHGNHRDLIADCKPTYCSIDSLCIYVLCIRCSRVQLLKSVLLVFVRCVLVHVPSFVCCVQFVYLFASALLAFVCFEGFEFGISVCEPTTNDEPVCKQSPQTSDYKREANTRPHYSKSSLFWGKLYILMKVCACVTFSKNTVRSTFSLRE